MSRLHKLQDELEERRSKIDRAEYMKMNSTIYWEFQFARQVFDAEVENEAEVQGRWLGTLDDTAFVEAVRSLREDTILGKNSTLNRLIEQELRFRELLKEKASVTPSSDSVA